MAINKFFYWICAIAAIVILAYSNYTYRNADEGDFSIDKYLKNPEKYGGYQTEYFGKIAGISRDIFYIHVEDKIIKVYGSIEKPVLGETAVFLDFRKDGKIRMIDYHNYNYNYLLYAVSVLALAVFIVLFFMEWKFTAGGFKNA